MANLLERYRGRTHLTQIQQEFDVIWQESSRELGSIQSILPVLAAGSAYRFGRLAFLSTALAESRSAALLMGGASHAFALLSEATAYEFSHRALTGGLWKWEGMEGIKNGLLSSALTFGILRGSGSLLQNQNIFLRHFLQDSATLVGQDLSANYGLLPPSQQTWLSRLASTEITNIQMQGSLDLFAKACPNHHLKEMAGDLLLQSSSEFLSSKLFSRNESAKNSALFSMYSERDEVSGVKPIPRISIEAEFRAHPSTYEFLDWIASKKTEYRTSSAMDLLRQSLDIVMHPGRASAFEYGLAQRRVEPLLGLQRMHEMFGHEALTLEQFEKNFIHVNYIPSDRQRVLRMSPSDQIPRKIQYPREMERMKESLEIALSVSGGALETETEASRLFEMQANEDHVNHIWFYQALQFAGEVEGKAHFRPTARLLDAFGKENLNGTVLERAVSAMRARGLNPESEGVLEITIPHAEVVFGADTPYNDKAYLSAFVRDLETACGGAVKLVDTEAVLEAPLVIRIPSLSLFQELIRQVYSENAASFYYINGEASRDAMMKGREMGVAAVGMGFQPMILGDLGIMVSPWVYTIHDVFHAMMASKSSPAFRGFVASQYHALKEQAWLQNGTGKQYLGFLVDMNFGESGFFRQSLEFILQKIQIKVNNNDISRADFDQALVFLNSYHQWILSQELDVVQSPYYRDLERDVRNLKERILSLQKTYRWLGNYGLRARFALRR